MATSCTGTEAHGQTLPPHLLTSSPPASERQTSETGPATAPPAPWMPTPSPTPRLTTALSLLPASPTTLTTRRPIPHKAGPRSSSFRQAPQQRSFPATALRTSAGARLHRSRVPVSSLSALHFLKRRVVRIKTATQQATFCTHQEQIRLQSWESEGLDKY